MTAVVAAVALLAGCVHTSSTGTQETERETNVTKTVSVVVFGMEKSSAGNCPGSELDASRFVGLMRKLGYGSNIKTFINERGTIANFESSVSEAVRSDLAIIYYSGHGGSDDHHRLGTGINEDDGVDEFLCLYDGYYLDDNIWNIVSQSKGRVFLVFDCCHSKTMFRSPPMGEYAGLMYARADGQPEQFSILCWSGCPDNTYSYGSNEGGFFTSTMLKYWSSGISYDRLWRMISSDEGLKKAQICQQTFIGGQWNCRDEAFR